MHTLKVTFSDDVMLKIRDLAEEHNVIPATVVEDITRWFTEGRLRPVKEKKKNCSALGQRIKAAIKELGCPYRGNNGVPEGIQGHEEQHQDFV